VAKKAPAGKAVVKTAAVKKTPVKKTPAKKPVAKAAPAKKAPAKTTAKKAPAKAAPKKTAAAKKSAKDGGESIESLIDQREIDLKSVDEALGIKYDSTKDHPLIPGKFDMIIPPGTPRKLVLNMAKEFNLEVAMRNDYYVPIGVSDIQRELLVFRGDRKTIEKVSKEFAKRLKAFAK
jgi:hypothetical protein